LVSGSLKQNGEVVRVLVAKADQFTRQPATEPSWRRLVKAPPVKG
jgi:hypothetical protein